MYYGPATCLCGSSRITQVRCPNVSRWFSVVCGMCGPESAVDAHCRRHRPDVTRRYILLALAYCSSGRAPDRPERGALHPPFILRSACDRPVPLGRRTRHGCITQRHGKLHPRGGLPWISFLFVFFLLSL